MKTIKEKLKDGTFVQAEFKDKRIEELFEEINNLIYKKSNETKLPLAAVIGVLEMIKLDLFYDQNL